MTLTIIQLLAVVLLFVAIVLSMVRLFLGPTAADRLVAGDTLAVVSTAVIACLSAVFDNPLYLDVALVYGALSFVGSVALARTIEGKS
jgi:multicomponent Na+:H+ antiporter subunit F